MRPTHPLSLICARVEEHDIGHGNMRWDEESRDVVHAVLQRVSQGSTGESRGFRRSSRVRLYISIFPSHNGLVPEGGYNFTPKFYLSYPNSNTITAILLG